MQGVRHQICIALLMLRHNHLVLSKFQLSGTPLSLSFTAPRHCSGFREIISICGAKHTHCLSFPLLAPDEEVSRETLNHTH